MTSSAVRQVFVSYAWRDARSFALSLVRWLESEGYRPWMDVVGRVPGPSFDLEIERGILQSDILIAVLSSGSLNPQVSFCRREWLFADAHGVPIIPVRLTDQPLPVQIADLHTVDASVEGDRLFEVIGAQIKSVLGRGEPQRRRPTSLDGSPRWWETGPAWRFKADLIARARSFIGREWLFEAIRTWLAETDDRCLFITAGVGHGKTAIATQLTAVLDVKGVHCCSALDPESCRFPPFIRGIVFQLAAQLPAFSIEVEALDPPNWALTPLEIFERYVARPFQRCQDDFDVAPWVIVIDGLDESLATEGPRLADLLCDALDGLPPGLRLIVTSRPQDELVARFSRDGVRRIDLDGRPENAREVAAYVESRVRSVTGAGEADRRALAREISEAAGESFLFAELVLDGLSDGDFRTDGALTKIVPGRVGGLYHSLFRKRFPDARSYRETVAPILECLIAARAPLPRSILHRVAGGRGHGAIGTLSQFVRDLGGALQLTHWSLAEWLREPTASGEFALTGIRGDELLSEIGLGVPPTNCSASCAYFHRYLAIHLAGAGRMEALIDLLADDRLGLVARWTDSGETEEGILCLTPLLEHLARSGTKLTLAAELATQLARLHSISADRDASHRWLQFAIRHAPRLAGRRVRAVALHELASLLLYRGALDESRSQYLRALCLTAVGLHRDADETAANLVSLALVRLVRHRRRSARFLAGLARVVADRAHDYGHASAARRVMANTYKDERAFERAHQLLDDAGRIARISGNVREQVSVLLELGWLQYHRTVEDGSNDFSAARSTFERGMQRAEDAQIRLVTPAAEIGILACALATADPTCPERLSAMERRVSGDLPYDLHVEMRLTRANVDWVDGKSGTALASYEATIDWAGRFALRTREADAWVGKGAVHWHAGDFTGAQRCWETARERASRTSPLRAWLTETSIERCRRTVRAVPF